MKQLVIDCDPGVDDAHALMMAIAHPDAQIKALTTTFGNVPVARTTRNALTILEAFDLDVPVYPGANLPLLSTPMHAEYVHGQDGLGHAEYPPPARQPEPEHAVHALIRLANESPGELTLVALGPLTNLALAARLDPDLPGKYKELIVMGGATRGLGNSPNVSVEFNIYNDPEAAAIVWMAWPYLTMVDWQATMNHGLSIAEIEALLAIDTPRSQMFRRITPHIIESLPRLGRTEYYAADALAMLVVLEPGSVRRREDHFVQVELHGAHTRGQTTVDWRDKSSKPPNTDIVVDVDKERFLECWQQSLQ